MGLFLLVSAVLAHAPLLQAFGYLTVYYSLSEKFLGVILNSSFQQRIYGCYCQTSQLEAPWNTCDANLGYKPEPRASRWPEILRVHFFLSPALCSPHCLEHLCSLLDHPYLSLCFGGISAPIRFPTLGRLRSWVLPACPSKSTNRKPRFVHISRCPHSKSGFRVPHIFPLHFWLHVSLTVFYWLFDAFKIFLLPVFRWRVQIIWSSLHKKLKSL